MLIKTMTYFLRGKPTGGKTIGLPVDPTKVMEVCSFVIKQTEMPIVSISYTNNKNAYFIMYKINLHAFESTYTLVAMRKLFSILADISSSLLASLSPVKMRRNAI